MSNELTPLLERPSNPPPVQSNVAFIYELAIVISCFTSKILYYYLRFFPPEQADLVTVLVCSALSNDGASGCWSWIAKSLHGAVYEKYCEAINDEATLDELKKVAEKANKKAESITDVFRVRLEIIDLAISSLMCFSRTGGGLIFAIPASVLVLVLPWVLQRALGLDKLVSQVTQNKEETKGAR